MEYKHRIADQMLSKKLASKGAILIEGPKWCGKTTTAEQQANSILYMDNPASLDTNLQMAEIRLQDCYYVHMQETKVRKQPSERLWQI